MVFGFSVDEASYCRIRVEKARVRVKQARVRVKQARVRVKQIRMRVKKSYCEGETNQGEGETNQGEGEATNRSVKQARVRARQYRTAAKASQPGRELWWRLSNSFPHAPLQSLLFHSSPHSSFLSVLSLPFLSFTHLLSYPFISITFFLQLYLSFSSHLSIITMIIPFSPFNHLVFICLPIVRQILHTSFVSFSPSITSLTLLPLPSLFRSLPFCLPSVSSFIHFSHPLSTLVAVYPTFVYI